MRELGELESEVGFTRDFMLNALAAITAGDSELLKLVRVLRANATPRLI